MRRNNCCCRELSSDPKIEFSYESWLMTGILVPIFLLIVWFKKWLGF